LNSLPLGIVFDLSLQIALKRTFRSNDSHKIMPTDISHFVTKMSFLIILRKEVIQPQVPLRLPCYDLVPIIELTFGASLLAVSIATSGPPNFRGLTGGVYKAQEHIHRSMLTYDY
jgi:hypothetical protein